MTYCKFIIKSYQRLNVWMIYVNRRFPMKLLFVFCNIVICWLDLINDDLEISTIYPWQYAFRRQHGNYNAVDVTCVFQHPFVVENRRHVCFDFGLNMCTTNWIVYRFDFRRILIIVINESIVQRSGLTEKCLNSRSVIIVILLCDVWIFKFHIEFMYCFYTNLRIDGSLCNLSSSGIIR